MGNSCRLTPKVFKRKGTGFEEVDSQLFQRIKEAVEDYETAWNMWSFTKTDEFKRLYKDKDLEYDELGEVTFPSLIKALGLEETYKNQRSIAQVVKDYGFSDAVFSPAEAVQKINAFNAKEKKFIATTKKGEKGHSIEVTTRTPQSEEKARRQAYNYALTGEIISLMRRMGFDVSWVNDPKYEGLFDPENATLQNGLLTIIKIAKGEVGEKALPEEFSHLIIEGLINHPLVKRLLASITNDQMHEVLGDNYYDYYEEYEGDLERLKRETAGKMLGEYITEKSTIKAAPVKRHKSLLSRIWNWAKQLFSKATDSDIDAARNNAYNAIADIYNMIASEEVVPIVEKIKVVNSKTMYRMSPKIESKYSSPEAIARGGEYILAKRRNIEFSRQNRKKATATGEALKILQQHNEAQEYYQAIRAFLRDCQQDLTGLKEQVTRARDLERDQQLTDIKVINEVARLARYIDTMAMGYEEIITSIASHSTELNNILGDNDTQLDYINLYSRVDGIVPLAKACNDLLTELKKWKRDTSQNILYRAILANGYRGDMVKGVGGLNDREKIMALSEILKHADGDINVIDRLFSAMSDSNDAFLVLMDSIVKNQQYDRDIEIDKYKRRITIADKKLREAGYSSSFMLELDEHGIPTGRIISEYDWDAYLRDLKQYKESLEEQDLPREEYSERLAKWKNAVDSEGNSRLIPVFVDPEDEAKYKAGITISPDKIHEMMPNPKFYKNKAHTIDNLAEPQKEYYREMMQIKREMMTKIPQRGQKIYKAIYISKDFIEGVLDGSRGNILKATLEYYRKKYTRRPDDIGFGTSENFAETVKQILREEKSSTKAAERILLELKESMDEDISVYIKVGEIKKIIKQDREFEKNIEQIVSDVLEAIEKENYYIVDTDFANHTIQKLPVYFTRPFKHKENISTDFSGCMTAYMAMSINYEKMNEVVDILEIGRDWTKDRDLAMDPKTPTIERFRAFGKVYRSFVERSGNGSNIADKMDDYMDSVVYGETKKDEGTIGAFGINLDVAKSLDAIRDYTGLLGLGFNIFSTVSNITVGKIQQWIEAVGGEYFTVADYMKACAQYAEHLVPCMLEMNSPIKKDKLSLLIEMFDPMGDYYAQLRGGASMHKNPLVRIFGNSTLAFIGMNAGEHMLRCQTMLAMLNAIKLTDTTNNNEKISLWDALEVEEDEHGLGELKLKKGLVWERIIIDNNGNSEVNKNYGRPLKDENGKIVTEKVSLDDSNNFRRYIIKQKRKIHKINDSLNGAFSEPDKGGIHRKAIGRMIIQYRQWMPAHYERRFGKEHYDDDLEQYRIGYYRTASRLLVNLSKDIAKAKIELVKTDWNTLNEHEKANIRRALTEVAWFFSLMTLCKLGGKVKDKDRNWLNKMVLYQIHRMYLEVGSSMPSPSFPSNVIQIMQSPAAAISFFEKCNNVLKFYNMFDEIQSGRYQGWSEWERDALKLTPLDQIIKGYVFDDSMFSMYEKDD